MEERIRINTTQNVVISYVPAGIGERMLAALLDNLFIFSFIFLSYSLIGMVMAQSGNFVKHMMVISVIIMLPVLLYHLLSELFMNGQSFGKKIMKIKVVKLDGTQPDIGALLIRWAFRILDGMMLSYGVGLFSIIFSDKSQRVGDIAAGTTVVSMKQKASLKDTILFKRSSDYKVYFNEVARLSDKDVQIMKEVFAHCAKVRDYQTLNKLVLRVKEKMKVQSEMPDAQFVKVVLLDYSHYQFQ